MAQCAHRPLRAYLTCARTISASRQVRYDGDGFAGYAIVVAAAGPAAAAGLCPGDEIIGVDHVALEPGDLLTEHVPDRRTFSIRVRRAPTG